MNLISLATVIVVNQRCVGLIDILVVLPVYVCKMPFFERTYLNYPDLVLDLGEIRKITLI